MKQSAREGGQVYITFQHGKDGSRFNARNLGRCSECNREEHAKNPWATNQSGSEGWKNKERATKRIHTDDEGT